MFQRNQPKGQVKIRVIEAKNLPAKDGIFNKTSDPYCIIKCGGQKKQTKIIKKTVDPYWNEEFIMPIWNPNQEMIQFELRDWDFGLHNRDDFLGSASFPLGNLQQGVEVDVWLGIGTSRGQLHVAVTALDFGRPPQMGYQAPMYNQPMQPQYGMQPPYGMQPGMQYPPQPGMYPPQYPQPGMYPPQ